MSVPFITSLFAMPSQPLRGFLGVCLVLTGVAAKGQDSRFQVYGRLQGALEHFASASDATGARFSVSRTSSYRSVIGLRGSERLGGDLSAIFQIEGTLALDTGAGAIAARDTRVGLTGRLGTLFCGHWATPYSASTTTLDPFYTTTASYNSIIGNGSAPSTNHTINTSAFDRRQHDTFAYWSPVMQGFSVRAAHSVGEQTGAAGARPSLTSLAALYERGALYFSIAQEHHHDYHGAGRNDVGRKAALAYRFGPVRIAAVVEQLRYETATGPLKRRAAYVSVTRQRGAHTVRLGAALAGDGTGMSTQTVGNIRSGPDSGVRHYTLGYDYSFSHSSSVFAYYTELANDSHGLSDFGGNGVGVAAGAHVRGAAVGLRHWF